MAPRPMNQEAERSAAPRPPRLRAEVDEDGYGNFKRQRTAIACNSCRYRKSRCDGEQPTCSTCSEMGFQCVYRRPINISQLPTMEYASQLENRLQFIEERLRTVASDGDRETTEGFVVPSLRNSLPFQNESEYSVTSGIIRLNSAEKNGERNGDNASQEDTVDGMGSITFADEVTSGYFGPSSNSTFFSYIVKALASNRGQPTQREETDQDLATSLSRPASPPLPLARPKLKVMNPCRLPPHNEMLRLVDLFFATTGKFFPYIHRKAVIDMIEELDISRSSGVRRSWLSLLNALLAIGTSLDCDGGRSFKHREHDSDTFFQRALTLSPWSISNTANLETRKSEMKAAYFDPGWPNPLSDSASIGGDDAVSSGNVALRADLEITRTPCSSCFPDGYP